NCYFLKIYRKVDRLINPDVEITHFLTEKAKFDHIPAFVGLIEWKNRQSSMVLGMMQDMVESHSDAWTYMLDRLNNFNERILSRSDSSPSPDELKGSFTDAIPDNELPDYMKDLMIGPVIEQTRLLGKRTGEMHLALASGTDVPDFKPEPFSLHYQRSLFSSFQSLVRAAFQNQSRNMKKLTDDIKKEAEEILGLRQDILNVFKRIYRKKIDVVKIRIHGDYHLGQV